MGEIDEAAVLRRGKELAAEDGFTWELGYIPSSGGRPLLRHQRFISEDRRQEYLVRARAELHKDPRKT